MEDKRRPARFFWIIFGFIMCLTIGAVSVIKILASIIIIISVVQIIMLVRERNKINQAKKICQELVNSLTQKHKHVQILLEQAETKCTLTQKILMEKMIKIDLAKIEEECAQIRLKKWDKASDIGIAVSVFTKKISGHIAFLQIMANVSNEICANK